MAYFCFTDSSVSDVEEGKKYVVVLDAGSTGTRLNVYHFDSERNLIPLSIERKRADYAAETERGLATIMRSSAIGDDLNSLIIEVNLFGPKGAVEREISVFLGT